jgi:hypothetical protein
MIDYLQFSLVRYNYNLNHIQVSAIKTIQYGGWTHLLVAESAKNSIQKKTNT